MEALEHAVEELAEMPSVSTAGLGAKGAALLRLGSIFGPLPALDEHEIRLVRSVAADAARLNVGEPVQLPEPVGGPLTVAWTEFRRLAPIVDRAFAAAERATAIYETQKPKQPDALIVRPDEFLGSSIRFVSEDGPAGTRCFSAQAVEHLRLNPRRQLIQSWNVDTGQKRPSVLEDDPVAQARADEIIAAFDDWVAECRRLSAEMGLEGIDAAASDLGSKLHKIGIRNRDTPTQSIHGIGIKAKWLLHADVAGGEEDVGTILRQAVTFAEWSASAAPP